MPQFGGVYANRRVLVTGDSGFKGSWLLQWLQLLQAQVRGLALPPTSTPNHFDLLKLPLPCYRGDVRDFQWVETVLRESDPEIVFHLAAQPLVRQSYEQPLETFSTNILGTANLLQACRAVPSLKAVVVVTTDKVYQNNEWRRGYNEHDQLGGNDPYSASKACAELVVHSFRKSFFHSNSPLIASVRAGNVIGGGDWCDDRLIPDIVRAATSGNQLEIRSPQATRPWQHVLDCLSGYLMIGQALLEGKTDCATEWNIGPEPSDNRPVIEILEKLSQSWSKLRWKVATEAHKPEAKLLYLDCSKAKSDQLGWRPVWNLDTALHQTVDWYQAYYESGQVLTKSQLEIYTSAALKQHAKWVR